MVAQPVRLKYLLQQRHWQTYRTFRAEYDKAAREIDVGLVGAWPSRAQLHRWLSGELKGLPYSDHCRILERMFPDWTAAQLFEQLTSDQARHLLESASKDPDQQKSIERDLVADLEVFVDLNEEDNRLIAQRIRSATAISFIAHTGYNAMVSQYQGAIRDAVISGCKVRVIVSDPDGPLMAESELTTRLCPSIRQAGEIMDVWRACARHRALAVKNGLPDKNVQFKFYVGPPSMNLLMVDGWLRVIPYLPLIDAAECPVFEYHFDPREPSSLISKYLLSLERAWENSKEVDLSAMP